MIDAIGFIGAQTRNGLDRKGSSREIHSPEHQPGGGEINAAGVDDAKYLGAVEGEIAESLGNTQARNADKSAGARHVVEAAADVEVMAAAGASANGGASAVASVGQDVATGANDQALRGHSISVGDSWGEVKKKMKADVTKVTSGAIRAFSI